MSKEEEQVLPLVVEKFSIGEQALLLWQFLCSIPVNLMAKFLPWVSISVSSDERLEMCICLCKVTPKENLLQQAIFSMAGKTFTFLNEIDLLSEELTLKLRLIKKWRFEQRNKDGLPEIKSMEYIFIDEKGTKIHARVFPNNFAKFNHLLIEGKTYFVKNPNMGANEDVIGEVVGKGDLDSSNADRTRHRMTMDIQNIEGLQLKVTLWGENARRMSEFINNNDNIRRSFVTTYYDVSKLFINEDLPEINSFKKDLLASFGEETTGTTIRSIPSRVLKSDNEEFLQSYEIKNVCDILDPFKDCKYVVVGTIYSIRQNLRWFYKACKTCSRRVTRINNINHSIENGSDGVAETSVLRCKTPECNFKEVIEIPRFMIPIQVQDVTGTACLTLFNKDAVKLLGIDCADLLNKNLEVGNSMDLFPGEINVLKGRKLAFIVEVNEYNVSHNNNVYGISKATSNETIIAAIENKLSPQHTTLSDSINFGPLDFGSQETKSVKDCISQTGENVTPCNVEKSTASSPIKVLSITPEFKRNLDDVYEAKNSLLIPKVEK